MGTPEPTITWYKDGILIPDQNLPFLYIPEMQLEDRGFYHCVAKNVIRKEGGLEITVVDTSEKVVVNIHGEQCRVLGIP